MRLQRSWFNEADTGIRTLAAVDMQALQPMSKMMFTRRHVRSFTGESRILEVLGA